MKSLFLTTQSALALSLALTAIAAAQKPGLPNKTAPANGFPNAFPNDPPEATARTAPDVEIRSSARPVAEAKKSYQTAHERLQNLVKGGGLQAAEPPLFESRVTRLDITIQEPRDRLRAAVADDKAALDVEEAEADLESAERAYMRLGKLHASGAIEKSVLDEQADKYNRAKIQLDRAEAKLNAFDQPPAGDGAANDQPATDKAEAEAGDKDGGATLGTDNGSANR